MVEYDCFIVFGVLSFGEEEIVEVEVCLCLGWLGIGL